MPFVCEARHSGNDSLLSFHLWSSHTKGIADRETFSFSHLAPGMWPVIHKTLWEIVVHTRVSGPRLTYISVMGTAQLEKLHEAKKYIHHYELLFWKWYQWIVMWNIHFELSFLHLGIESFLMYSVHEGIRGIPLEPSDKMDALMPISGTAFAVGIDFHAGKWISLTIQVQCSLDSEHIMTIWLSICTWIAKLKMN